MNPTGLNVDADLTIDSDGDRIFIRGAGSHLTVELPNVGSAFRLMRKVRATGLLRRQGKSIQAILKQTGLSVTVQTPKRKLMTLSSQQGSRLMRLFGMTGIQFHSK